MVAEVVGRLRSTTSAHRDASIGVVTFNGEQRALIEDLLDKARRDEPGLERFFSDDHPEPVLVKNLEGVQGEERDVAVFSLTYGPDVTGRVAMNFGPLNQSGGKRRLNLAVSGTSVEEIFRKMGVSEPRFYRLKKPPAGMGVAESRR